MESGAVKDVKLFGCERLFGGVAQAGDHSSLLSPLSRPRLHELLPWNWRKSAAEQQAQAA
ncbi:hypothetical protein WCLP8_1810004 [uncultured Gammaproteobacteria bacterium]